MITETPPPLEPCLQDSLDPDIVDLIAALSTAAEKLGNRLHLEKPYNFGPLGKGMRLVAMAAAHHRFNYIHPFPDGNGRVSRLMSHAMALQAGVGAHGLWSVSRGLARGQESLHRTELRAKKNESAQDFER